MTSLQELVQTVQELADLFHEYAEPFRAARQPGRRAILAHGTDSSPVPALLGTRRAPGDDPRPGR